MEALWPTQSRVKSIFLACFFVVLPVVCIGQDAGQLTWPRHALRLSTGRAWEKAIEGVRTEGPDRAFAIVGFKHWNLSVGYEYLTTKKVLFGAEARLVQSVGGIEATLDRQEDTGGNGSGNVFRYIPSYRFSLRMDHPELTLSVGKVLWSGPKIRIDGALVGGVIPLWSTSRTSFFQHTIPGDTSATKIFSGSVDWGLDIWPLFGMRAAMHLKLPKLNLLTVQLDARFTTATFYTGEYVIYPETATPTRGTLSSDLAYIGLNIGYAFTWGPPKLPKWMRE